MRKVMETGRAAPWAEKMKTLCGVVDVVLSITHQRLYRSAVDVIAALQSDGQASNALRYWHTSFNGVALISNRQTPRHRDCKTHYTWYDVLVTTGTYSAGIFEITPLGIRLRYRSGTLIALCGALMEHAASSGGGERVCWAFFMRNDVHDWAQAKRAHWSEYAEVVNDVKDNSASRAALEGVQWW